jgi:hypothetical protein
MESSGVAALGPQHPNTKTTQATTTKARIEPQQRLMDRALNDNCQRVAEK